MAISHPLTGPKLKLARAKSHLADFESAIVAYRESEPYTLRFEHDASTGENVFYVVLTKCLPPELSVIAGDVVHNLRSALDQMVCGLVRANGKQVRTGNGFPIMGSEKSFDEACVGKLKNVSAKADRFIRRLKPYRGAADAFWMLAELDNLDKHNSIVPVLIGKAQTVTQIAIPFLSIPPEGGLAIGGTPEGYTPFGHQWGVLTPEGAKPFAITNNEVEFYRSKPVPYLVEDVGFVAQIRFGKTSVTNDEIIHETLDSLIQLVERVIDIVERRIL